jgi:hypothetical protein
MINELRCAAIPPDDGSANIHLLASYPRMDPPTHPLRRAHAISIPHRGPSPSRAHRRCGRLFRWTHVFWRQLLRKYSLS